MTGQLTINGQDAFTAWGVSLTDGALAVLMTPAGLKDRVTNTSRLEHGTRYIKTNNKFQQRELTLEMHMTAPSKSAYMAQYADWCDDVLATGELNIRTSYQSGVEYRCLYVSCTQFTQYADGGIAKFALKLIEPDPTDRGLHV